MEQRQRTRLRAPRRIEVEVGEELQRLGLVVGRIVAVAEHAGARAPSYILTLDLGAQGRHECSSRAASPEPDELEGHAGALRPAR